MDKRAEIAVRAAKNWKKWGRVAAYKYAAARLSPSDLRLYFLARTLDAAQSIKEVK